MALLTKFETSQVLKFAYNDKQIAIQNMKRSISLYWSVRNKSAIARSRLKSAIAVIRNLSN